MARTSNIAWFLDEYRKHERGIPEQDSRYYWWIPIDRPILTAFKEHRDHSDSCEVGAKVALVNRMYSAQLGRGRVEKYKAEDAVTSALCNSDIDKFIEPLFSYKTLSEPALQDIIKCHDRLVKIVRRGAKTDASPFPPST